MDKAWRYVGDPTVDEPSPATVGGRVFRLGDVTADDMSSDNRFVVIVSPDYTAPAIVRAAEPAPSPAEEAPAPVIAPTS